MKTATRTSLTTLILALTSFGFASLMGQPEEPVVSVPADAAFELGIEPVGGVLRAP